MFGLEVSQGKYQFFGIDHTDDSAIYLLSIIDCLENMVQIQSQESKLHRSFSNHKTKKYKASSEKIIDTIVPNVVQNQINSTNLHDNKMQYYKRIN